MRNSAGRYRMVSCTGSMALACLALAVLVCAHPAKAEPRRLALVLGNSLYDQLPMVEPCAASANIVTAALRRAGFTVTLATNVSNGQMGAAIASFAEAVAKESDTIAVGYLCGCAISYDGRIFLLPASAHLQRDTDVLTQGIVSRVFVNAVLRSGARAGLVLMENVSLPNADAPLPLAGLADPARMGRIGLAAVEHRQPPPDGPTLLAAAVSASFAATDVDAQAVLREIRNTVLVTAQRRVLVLDPAEPAWLVGMSPALVPPASVLQAAIAPAPIEPAPTVAAPTLTAAVPAAPIATPAPSPAAQLRAMEPAMLNQADMRRIQLALQRLGYYAGKVDGIVGQDTLAAIRRFQHELRMDMTGRLTKEQADRLLAAGS